MRRRYVIAALVMLAGCEDTRRADRSPREGGRSYGGFDPYGSSRVNKKLDDVQAKLDDLQAKLVVPATPALGAYECDELIRLTHCMYDKTPGIPPDTRKMFDDALQYWRDALDNPSTRQATIDACKMSLDAGRQGFNSAGCW